MTNKEVTEKWHKVYCEDNLKKYKEERLAKENSKLESEPMWNYRIIKDGETYGLYEVFYNDDGDISFHSENPDTIGESVDDIVKSLELMLGDAKKHIKEKPVLEKDKIEFKDLYDYDKEKMISYDIDDLDKLLEDE